MTPEQISTLEQRLNQLEDAGVDANALRQITQQQAPIFVTVNREHNLVIVRTSDVEAMKSIEQLVLKIDRPTPQVLLEMKILEITLDDSLRSIFDVQFASGTQGPTALQQSARNPFLLNAATAAQNVLGLGNFPVSGGTLVYQFLNDNVRARIELLESQDRVRRVATPMLLASNNRPATIFVGEERVMTTGVNTDVVTPATGATTTSVEPVTEIRNIGTTLMILPKINADRTVTLVISQEASSVNVGSATIPTGQNSTFAVDTVNTATVNGTIVARDGLTVALGGLIREESRDFVQKVPWFGDLPIIGYFFRREVHQNLKTELVLLITPHILSTPAEGERTTYQRLSELSDHPYYTHQQFRQSVSPNPIHPGSRPFPRRAPEVEFRRAPLPPAPQPTPIQFPAGTQRRPQPPTNR